MIEALQPENVAVVVNTDSWASTALADAYLKLRRIPAEHRIAISGLSNFEQIGIDEFRDRILRPVLATLEQRNLREQIDCLAYSADIPHAISFRGDLGGAATPPQVGDIGALTGLTFLYEAVLARAPQTYTALDANRYARRAYAPGSTTPFNPDDESINRWRRLEAFQQELTVPPPRRFRAGTAWDARGEPTTAPDGRRYLLATMLGVTGGRGTSLREAVDGLARAAAADGTRPDGTIYYMFNSDIRTRTRCWGFHAAIRLLADAGVKAVIEAGDLPNGRQDIAGAMVGIATFDAAGANIRVQPGAICEHLTSCGGILTWNGAQTPLTEFLRHGAAGAAGTVAEPYAIQAKFPDPFIQVHYVRGSSLAEAFYQSVTGPYQLLVVGDPLCRPWGPPRTAAAAAAAPARLELPPAFGPVAADNAAAPAVLGRGFRAIGADGARMVSGVLGDQHWSQAAGIAPEGDLTLEGHVEVRTNGVHQFQVRSTGEVELTVSGQRLPATGQGPWRTYPVALAPGWHSLRLTAKAGAPQDGPAAWPLEANFGAAGAPPLPNQLHCAPQPGDRVRYVGLSPRVTVPTMTDDPFDVALHIGVNGLEPTTAGSLTLNWELPADSGWSIAPPHAVTPVTGGAVAPVVFRVQYRGVPFQTNDFFRLGTCRVQVQTAFGTEPAAAMDFPLEQLLRERPRPEIRVPRAAAAPQIDGRLDDRAWAEPASIARFIRPGLDAPVEQPTAAWLAWDARQLYLAVRCTEPHLDRLRLAATQRDGPAHADDSIELFLGFGDDAGTYYQVVLNAAGTIFDGKGYDNSWNGEYQVATGREDGAWTAELAAPWATFGVSPPKPGTALRLLIVRNRKAADPAEASTWPAAPGGNHQPRLFGRAVLE